MAALIVGALADWIAALGEGVEHFRRFAFYLLCGFGLLMSGAFLTYSHYRTLALMLSFAGIHALVYAMSVFSFELSHLHGRITASCCLCRVEFRWCLRS